jgi:hypothetical protein
MWSREERMLTTKEISAFGINHILDQGHNILYGQQPPGITT